MLRDPRGASPQLKTWPKLSSRASSRKAGKSARQLANAGGRPWSRRYALTKPKTDGGENKIKYLPAAGLDQSNSFAAIRCSMRARLFFESAHGQDSKRPNRPRAQASMNSERAEVSRDPHSHCTLPKPCGLQSRRGVTLRGSYWKAVGESVQLPTQTVKWHAGSWGAIMLTSS